MMPWWLPLILCGPICVDCKYNFALDSAGVDCPTKCDVFSLSDKIGDGNAPKSHTPKSKRQSCRANDQYGVTPEDGVLVTAVTELT